MKNLLDEYRSWLNGAKTSPQKEVVFRIAKDCVGEHGNDLEERFRGGQLLQDWLDVVNDNWPMQR